MKTILNQPSRPATAMVIVWLTFLHIYRLSAIGIVIGALAGPEAASGLLPSNIEMIPISWLLPAGVDLLAAVTAPVIAYLLWQRRGLGVWVMTLIWHALACYDIMTGITLALIEPLAETGGAGQAGFLAITAFIHLITIYLLTRSRIKHYYLDGGFNPESTQLHR